MVQGLEADLCCTHSSHFFLARCLWGGGVERALKMRQNTCQSACIRASRGVRVKIAHPFRDILLRLTMPFHAYGVGTDLR